MDYSVQKVILLNVQYVYILCTVILVFAHPFPSFHLQQERTGWTALHYASSHGQKDCVQLLLEKGLFVCVKDIAFFTATTVICCVHVYVEQKVHNNIFVMITIEGLKTRVA